MFRFFKAVNLGARNSYYPKRHIKCEKIVILFSGGLINGKTGEEICSQGKILFEKDLLKYKLKSLNNNNKVDNLDNKNDNEGFIEKIDYPIFPKPDALILEGDTKKILEFFKVQNLGELLEKSRILQILSEIPLFKPLSKRKLAYIADKIKTKTFKASQPIIQKVEDRVIKDSNLYFYIIKSGEVIIHSKEGGLIKSKTLKAKNFFGEDLLFKNENYTDNNKEVISKTDTELYLLSKNDFLKGLSNEMKHFLFKRLFFGNQVFELRLEELIFASYLGENNTGLISLVLSNNKNYFPYMIKCIPKKFIDNENLHKNIEQEKNILQSIDHPFFIKLIKCFKDEINIYFLLEYCEGQELFRVIRDIGLLSKTQTQFYVASMLLAMDYLHTKKIIYRDIKPENVFVSNNGYIKFTNFGTAKIIKDRTNTIIGTPHYIAPEMLLGEAYSFEVDIWSIGVCLYEFYCGETPFGEDTDDSIEIYMDIINQKLTFPRYENVQNDKNFQLLAKSLLIKDPSRRLTNINSIKNHSWFKNFEWEDLVDLSFPVPYLPNIKESKILLRYKKFMNNFGDIDEENYFDDIESVKAINEMEKYVEFIQKYSEEKGNDIYWNKKELFEEWYENFFSDEEQ